MRIWIACAMVFSIIPNSFAVTRKEVCAQAEKPPGATETLKSPPAALLEAVGRYQKIWRDDCKKFHDVVLANGYVALKDLAAAIQNEAVKDGAQYDRLLVEYCAWAAVYSPGLACPAVGHGGTFSVLEDSRARLAALAAVIGTESDRAFFSEYDQIWGRGSNRGRPWQQDTLAAGIAFVDGCKTFHPGFWNFFFQETTKKIGKVRRQIYSDAVRAQQDRAVKALLELNSPVCACESQADVLKSLETLQKTLRPLRGLPQGLSASLAKSAEGIRKGKIKILEHAKTQCGGG